MINNNESIRENYADNRRKGIQTSKMKRVVWKSKSRFIV